MTTNNLSAKVSEKGAVSVIGLQRFPVTLYESQWRALAAAMPGIVKALDQWSKEKKQDGTPLLASRAEKAAKEGMVKL